MKYTLEQLNKLRFVRSLSCNNSISDERYLTERGFFNQETERFLNWIEKMEKLNRIDYLLSFEDRKINGETKDYTNYFYKYF